LLLDTVPRTFLAVVAAADRYFLVSIIIIISIQLQSLQGTLKFMRKKLVFADPSRLDRLGQAAKGSQAQL